MWPQKGPLKHRTSVYKVLGLQASGQNEQTAYLYQMQTCRFDLLHVMVDDTTEATDARIATHIVNVHRYQQNAFDVPYDTESLQHYIRYARSIKPEMTAEVSDWPLQVSLQCIRHSYASFGMYARPSHELS